MNLKFFVFCPDDEKVIRNVITAGANAGAGIIGNYTHNAFITKGQGNWKSEEGSNPTIGKVGEFSSIQEVKVEMICRKDIAKKVKDAIIKVHPYEEPVIDFYELIKV